MKRSFNELHRGVVNYSQTYSYSSASSQASTFSTLTELFTLSKPSIIRFQGIAQITYKTLHEQWTREYQEQNKCAQVVANARSALNGFMNFHSYQLTDTVGDELRADLERYLSAYVSMLKENRKPNTSINSKVALIRKCGKFVKRLDAREDSIIFGDGLPAEFGPALRELKDRAGISKDRLGRIAGVASGTIQQWYEGKCLPAFRNRHAVPKLAHALGVDADTLLLRCNLKGLYESFERLADAKCSELKKSNYRTRHGENIATPYTLRHGTPRLKVEWTDVVRFKTRGTPSRLEPRNEAWSLREEGRSSYKNDWYNSVGRQHCPTASAVWCQVSAYLGWLALPTEMGGRGMDSDKLTLGYLLDMDAVVEFWNWRITQRCGGVRHRGMEHSLGSIAALLRENSGYLYHHPEYALVLAETERERLLHRFGNMNSPEAWRAACIEAYSYFHTILKGDKKAKRYLKSRDPKTPILAILASSSPIDYVEQLLRSMDRAKPMPHQKWDYLCHHRDHLLINLMKHFPLRVQMYEIMTYRDDQTGNLYKHEGLWHIYYEPQEFKNATGAIASLFKNSFDVTLPDNLNSEIEHYIKEIFPLLSTEKSDYLFRPYGTSIAVRWISQRFRALTRKFIPGSPGFSAHAFRHIIATDWLKKNPCEYYTVAYVLQDTIKTVMQQYGHINASDGVKPYMDYLNRRGGDI